jgi:hypothetical protein
MHIYYFVNKWNAADILVGIKSVEYKERNDICVYSGFKLGSFGNSDTDIDFRLGLKRKRFFHFREKRKVNENEPNFVSRKFV